jgi:general stress protein CsbA
MIKGTPISGERIYLRFLVFYALAFPAYIIVRFKWSGTRSLIAFAIVVVALAPLYEIGLMHGRTWMATIAVAALLIIGLIPKKKRPATELAGPRF